MSAWHELVEREHDLQNPTSAEKIRLVGEYLRLGPESRVLDIACGKAGPAVVLARAFGCRIHGVEVSETFVTAARRRISEAGLEQLVDVELAEASRVELQPGAFDAALCIGAAFVWGHIGDAAAGMLPALVPHGGIAIGEPFWRRSGRKGEDFVDLHATVARFESAGVELTGLVAASEDDWDRYEPPLARGRRDGRRRGAREEPRLPRRLPQAPARRARLGDLRRAEAIDPRTWFVSDEPGSGAFAQSVAAVWTRS